MVLRVPGEGRVDGRFFPHWTSGGKPAQTASVISREGAGSTEPDAESDSQDFVAMRRRRAELLESINALEQALAAPGQQMRWVERVAAALLELSADFREHVELTVGPRGLYSRVLRSSPRLAHEVDRLTQEHTMLADLLGELLTLVGQGDKLAVQPDPMLGDHAQVRERGTKLLGALVRHRQRGSDLIYEAYSVDIGGED
jgi:hypothetical protein